MATKSAPDLDAMSVEDLKQLRDAVDAAMESKQSEARTQLVEEMTARATALGLSLSDLLPAGHAPAPSTARKPRSDAGKTAAVKYRGPGGQTWSGRGRKPTWLNEMEANGKNKEEFAV